MDSQSKPSKRRRGHGHHNGSDRSHHHQAPDSSNFEQSSHLAFNKVKQSRGSKKHKCDSILITSHELKSKQPHDGHGEPAKEEWPKKEQAMWLDKRPDSAQGYKSEFPLLDRKQGVTSEFVETAPREMPRESQGWCCSGPTKTIPASTSKKLGDKTKSKSIKYDESSSSDDRDAKRPRLSVTQASKPCRRPRTTIRHPLPSSAKDTWTGAPRTPKLGQKRRCYLLELPVEVRENIYRTLLVTERPIQVRQGWTCIYPRCRPGLHTSIMRACRQIACESVGVLYGENNFLYLVRERTEIPELSAHGTMLDAGSESSEFEESASENGNSDVEFDGALSKTPGTLVVGEEINIRKFGHLIRKITIVTEANRTEPEYRETMANAINVFTGFFPIRANIHTITIEITPKRDRFTRQISFLDFFTQGSSVTRALKKLPRQYIEVIVNTPMNRKVVLKTNMRSLAFARRAKRGEEDLWEKDALIQAARRQKCKSARKSLNSLVKNIRELWKSDDALANPNGSEDGFDTDLDEGYEPDEHDGDI